LHILLVDVVNKLVNMWLMKTSWISDGGKNPCSPNGFDASGSDAPPPPPNMTIQEQFMVTQTEVMCQLLQTWQQLTQQLQNNPRGENIEG
jgi:hypothetical protein